MGVRLVAVGAFAVTIAAAVTVVQSLGGADHDGRPRAVIPGLPVGPVANAQEALERAARAAEGKPFVEPRPDQWMYTEERTTASPEGRRAGSSEPLSRVRREWRRVDGTQTAYLEDGKLRIVKTPQPPKKRRGSPSAAPSAPPFDPWQSYAYLKRLPTDPDALLRLAYRSLTAESIAPEPQNEAVYTLFTHVLRENVLPPKVEAAIFRAMAKIKGVTLYPKVTDVTGRPALNLGMTTAADMREDLLLDRQTYAYLGERSLTIKDELSGKIYPGRKVLVKKGTEYVFARIVTKIVDNAGDRS
jgi:hypothetical protein